MKISQHVPSFLRGMILLFLMFPQIVQSQVHQGFSLTPRQKAEALLVRKDYKNAIVEYKKLISERKGRGYIIRGLVKSFQGAKQMKEGRSFLNQALANASHPSDFLYGLGYGYFLEGQFEDSEIFLWEAVETNPQNALAHNNLAAILSKKSRFSEALQQVKIALSQNPQERIFFQNLFLIYRKMGHPQRFRDEFENYRNSGEKDLASGYGAVLGRNLRQEGFRLYSKKQTEPAIAKFEEMVEIYQSIEHLSGLTASYFSLGLLYEEQGSIQKALQYFKQVLSLSPNHIQARQKLKNLENQLK